MPTFSERVIEGSLRKYNLLTTALPIDPKTLDIEYGLAQAIDSTLVSLSETDMVVVLSGRSGFSGTYLEAADKYALCENEYDATDTMRRMAYGINIAKQGTQRNLDMGVRKPIYVYFNGVKRQNEELRELLNKRGELNGYPAAYFIIDSIPLDNTLGQVLGLSLYLDTHWPYFCKYYNLSRAPNLVICTSSYHVPRVTLAHGSNSPLLTADFWRNQPELLKRLSPSFCDYVLNPGETLKKSSLMVLGCDRQITANAFWEKDLRNDMEARVCYSHLRKVPSIASNRADNDITVKSALALISLYRRGSSIFFNKVPGHVGDLLRYERETSSKRKLGDDENSYALVSSLPENRVVALTGSCRQF